MSKGRFFVVNVRSYSSGVPGRALCNARNHHWVEDEPKSDGRFGEAVNAAELLMSGVTACAVTLIEGLARELRFPLKRIEVKLKATKDREGPQVHKHVTVFHKVEMLFRLVGVTKDQAKHLVASYRQR